MLRGTLVLSLGRASTLLSCVKVYGYEGNHRKWEFLFSGFTSSQFAFLMIDFLPREEECLWGSLGTPTLSLTSSKQQPGYVHLRLFLPLGNPRPEFQTESRRLFIRDLRARGGDCE